MAKKEIMKKIAVNRCFGGFSLSNLALELYYKKKLGKNVYHFKENYETKYDNRKYLPLEKGYSGLFSVSFFVPNPNDFDAKILWDEHYVYDRPKQRDDKDLIETIEKLGSKKASGSCANVQIVEIPDDVNWVISEYDGMESVEEAHRSW